MSKKIHNSISSCKIAIITMAVVLTPSGKKAAVIIIGDAMWRIHRRPRIWGSAGCDSFRNLLRVNVAGCVGTVVYPYGSWRFLAFVFRFLNVLGGRFCDVCGASGARNEYKKRWQELLKIILKWPWRVQQSSKMRRRGVLGGTWEHSVS